MIQYKDFVSIYTYLISEGDEIVRACDRHWDEIVISRNMLPNINTCENGWPNFSANLRLVVSKLLELTQFAWPNQSIYFNFLCVPRDDVIDSTRFWWGHLLIITPWSRPNQLQKSKQELGQLPSARVGAEYRHFLLLSYFIMLTRIKMCYTVNIRMCCIGLCTYFYFIHL